MPRLPWKPGAAKLTDGPVVVSATDFAVDDWRDVPRVWLAGLRLRRRWPGMDGGLGLWLWASPLGRRSGSVSVWKSETDLRRFVTSPVHVEIVHRYRDRGSLASVTWQADDFSRRATWVEAKRRLDENRNGAGTAR